MAPQMSKKLERVWNRKELQQTFGKNWAGIYERNLEGSGKGHTGIRRKDFMEETCKGIYMDETGKWIGRN